MAKNDDKTAVLSIGENDDFTSIETSSTSKNIPQEMLNSVVDEGKPTQGSGIWHLPQNIMQAVREDFSMSAFVLILIGYVIIETFGSNGADIEEYLFLILVLFVATGIIRFLSSEKPFHKILDFFDSKRFLSVIIGLFFIDTIINHWGFLVSMGDYIQSIFQKQ
ncbi:MAG: hypothetical protein Q8P68_00985 [Candidatus Peregrinibacteria bacterium]|nr:hypothetical protein [Candidatus Peregrinibacteria bacterium]